MISEVYIYIYRMLTYFEHDVPWEDIPHDW